MGDNTLEELGRVLMRGVKAIDLECNRILNGVEYGLCNVNRQFREDTEAGLYPEHQPRAPAEGVN
jgi:hypothetical protein